MSTDAPRRRRSGAGLDEPGTIEAERRGGARRRPFGVALAATLAVLMTLGIGGVAFALTQGPRISNVEIDTLAVTEAGGQRIVFTANQALAPLEADQVTVEPAADFTLTVAGRHAAVQFTYPLDDDTEYRVAIEGAQGVSGGPVSTLAHEFRTGQSPLVLLQRRSDEDDVVFASNLAGDRAVPLYEAPQIEDVRASRDAIVAVTSDDELLSHVEVMARDGSDIRELPLPAAGTVTSPQIADHGGFVGYVFTGADVASGGIEASLFIARLGAPDADPVRIGVGDELRVQQWAFVPQTTALLVLTFDGQLRLYDAANPEGEPVALGTAIGIEGIERGTATAYVQRPDGSVVAIDLTDLSEETVPTPGGYGIAGPTRPSVGGARIQAFTELGPDGYPAQQRVVRIDADGASEIVFELDRPGDAIRQACASPNGRYVAVTVAPNLVDNPTDVYQRPLPQRLELHILDLRTGEEISIVRGSDPEWCAVAEIG